MAQPECTHATIGVSSRSLQLKKTEYLPGKKKTGLIQPGGDSLTPGTIGLVAVAALHTTGKVRDTNNRKYKPAIK